MQIAVKKDEAKIVLHTQTMFYADSFRGLWLRYTYYVTSQLHKFGLKYFLPRAFSDLHYGAETQLERVDNIFYGLQDAFFGEPTL